VNSSEMVVARCRIGRAEVIFSGREGGVSSGPFGSLNLGDHVGDDPVLVGRNRQSLADLIGVRAIVSMDQVHGSQVRRFDGFSDSHAIGMAINLGECDALVSSESNVGLLAMGADCLTVAFGCDDAVAVAHAGWRGLAAGVLEQTATEIAQVGRGEIHAAIGPAAGACCYEVSDEVISAFKPAAVHSDRMLDLAGTAEVLLRDLGVSSVRCIDACTICDRQRRFFSHRREGTPTGRQGAVAWLSS